MGRLSYVALRQFSICLKPFSVSHVELEFSPRHWNTGMMSSGVSLTSWGEGASLALVGHPSSDGITIKILYGVDVLLHRPASHPVFSYWVG